MSLSAADEVSQGTDADTAVVAKAFSKVRFLKGKPNPKAKYYIYLHSASWCGPCCREMPTIVKAYKKMKKQGFEIILFGHDETKDGVIAYAKRFKAKFPLLKDSPELASKVPGYRRVGGIPNIIVVDQSGKVIVQTHPASFFEDDQWKKYIPQETKENESDKDSSGDTAEGE